MTADNLTIGIAIAVAAFSALAGYLGRIEQKIEDRKDEIYLKELPGLASSLTSFLNSLEVYNSAKSFDQLSTTVQELTKTIKDQIFSGNIILSEKELYKELLLFYSEIGELNSCLQEITTETDAKLKETMISEFHKQYSLREKFTRKNSVKLDLSVTECTARELNDRINDKFQCYQPVSLWLFALIALIGILLGIIEVFKLIAGGT